MNPAETCHRTQPDEDVKKTVGRKRMAREKRTVER